MNHIDDYEMIDKDLDGSIQFARECFTAEEIANDTSRDWSERIIATAEIIFSESEGKPMRCRMPGCGKVATETWSLVDVCCHCCDDLRAETQKYYAKRIKADERLLYKQIQAIKGADKLWIG